MEEYYINNNKNCGCSNQSSSTPNSLIERMDQLERQIEEKKNEAVNLVGATWDEVATEGNIHHILSSDAIYKNYYDKEYIDEKFREANPITFWVGIGDDTTDVQSGDFEYSSPTYTGTYNIDVKNSTLDTFRLYVIMPLENLKNVMITINGIRVPVSSRKLNNTDYYRYLSWETFKKESVLKTASNLVVQITELN